MSNWLGLKIDIDKNRIFGLDVLRALAVTIVVVTHSESYCPPGVSRVIEAVYLDGVTIFFVLSGFLIGRILIKTLSGINRDTNTLVNFWWRRWTRTLPLYFLILCLVILGHNFPDFKAPTYRRFFFFSQNIFTPHPGFFIEAWSLSVEEWFYLLIPLLSFILVKYFRVSVLRTLLIISAVVILFSTGLRLERYFANLPINNLKFELLFRMQVVTRLDSLMYGVIGALVAYFNPARWQSRKMLKLVLGIGLLVLNKILDDLVKADWYVFYHTVFYLSLNSIGTLLTLPFLSAWRSAQGKLPQAVTYISLISYSLYLVNLTPVHEYLMPFINRHIIGTSVSAGVVRNVDLLLFFPMTLVLSVYLYRFVEKPFIRLRDKISFGLPAKKRKVEAA